jgi:hypothetical protein
LQGEIILSVIYFFDKCRHHAAMKNADIRRANARALAATETHQTDFAEKIGADNSRVSQLIGVNPTKNIGTATARRIEIAYCKPAGWLDQVHDGAVVLSPGQREWLQFYSALEPSERQLWVVNFRRATNIDADQTKAFNQAIQSVAPHIDSSSIEQKNTTGDSAHGKSDQPQPVQKSRHN